MSYVVINDRNKYRMYLGEDATWWRQLKKAKHFVTERAAQVAEKKDRTATGTRTLEEARRQHKEN